MPQQALRKSFDKGALWRFKGRLKVRRLCARRQETLPRLTRFREFSNFRPNLQVDCGISVPSSDVWSLSCNEGVHAREASMGYDDGVFNLHKHTYILHIHVLRSRTLVRMDRFKKISGIFIWRSSEVSQSYSPFSASYKVSLWFILNFFIIL